VSTRRDRLSQLAPQPTSHAGLWLDKYIGEQQRDNHQSRHELVKQVAERPVPDIYDKFYSRWVAVLRARGARTMEAGVQGRMAVGLGNEAVLESSIALHRTYGVPYIPGSALKGLASNYATTCLSASEWRLGGTGHTTIFGTMKDAGYITFFDALYVPDSGAKSERQARPLHPDVLAVHHPDYYKGGAAPADWDSPTVIPFLSATGKYLIAIGGSDGAEPWVETAFDILRMALGEMGVGAKTSSGYGRLSLARGGTAAVPSERAAATQGAPGQPVDAQVGANQPTAGPTSTGQHDAARLEPDGQVQAQPLTQSATGVVIYDQGKPWIKDASGKRWRVNWRELGVNDLAGKMAVEFDYVADSDGKAKVVRVAKRGRG